MVVPTTGDVRAFVARFRDVSFPHSAAVMPLFEGKDANVMIESSTVANTPELRRTYRDRAHLLASRAPEPPYPASLSDDVRALADALNAAEDQPVRIWRLSFPSGRLFMVFELVQVARIAGVLASVDRRVLAADREALD